MAWTKTKIVLAAGVVAVIAWQWHVNSRQTRQLAEQETRLQTAEQDAARQRDTIARLEKEAPDLTVARQQAELSASNALARAAAAATPPPSSTPGTRAAANPATPPATTGLARLISDPAMKEYTRGIEKNKAKTRYALLAKMLDLTPDATDQFNRTVGDYWMSAIEAAVGYSQGTLDRAQAAQAVAAAKSQLESQLRMLLGDQGFTQYEQFNQLVPGQAALARLNEQLGDNKLTAAQGAQLLDVIKGEPMNLTHGIAGELDPVFFSTQDKIDAYLQQVADSGRRILQAAAGTLTPDQLAALGTVLTNSIKSQLSQAAALAQKH